MSIRAQCGACFAQFNVKDQFAGQTLRCKTCGEKFRIPAADDYDEYGDVAESRRESGNRRRRTSRTKRKRTRQPQFDPKPWIIGAGGLAAVAVVVGIVIAGWNAIRKPVDADGAAVQQPGIAAQAPGATASGPDAPFSVTALPVPKFPKLARPVQRFPTGETVYFVECNRVPQPRPGPGAEIPNAQIPTVGNPATRQPPNAAVPIPAGTPVVVFQILSYSGSSDQTGAARQALTRVPWARAETVFINTATNEIVVGTKRRSINTGIAKSFLQRAASKSDPQATWAKAESESRFCYVYRCAKSNNLNPNPCHP